MKQLLRVASLALMLGLLVACGNAPVAQNPTVVPAPSSPEQTSVPTSPPAAAPATSAQAAGFPVTVENCGRTLTFDAPPERVISMWQPPTEMLLALGLQDRIVAVAGNYAPFRADQQAAADALTVIGTGMQWPSREVTLSEQPDFVISELLEGFAFDGNAGYATIAELEAAGAQVYSNNACTLADVGSKNIEQVYTDIANLGRIFGVSERADALIAELTARQEAVTSAVAGLPRPRVVFFNGGEGPLNVLSGGVWGDVVTQAGGQNVISPDLFQVSVEEFAAAQPDVILVGTFPGQEAEALTAYLEATFPNIPAVQNERLVPIATIDTEASVRVIDGLEQVARALHPEAFE
jgi:iron complex transport system substrate-binding protein